MTTVESEEEEVEVICFEQMSFEQSGFFRLPQDNAEELTDLVLLEGKDFVPGMLLDSILYCEKPPDSRLTYLQFHLVGLIAQLPDIEDEQISYKLESLRLNGFGSMDNSVDKCR